MAQAPLRKPSLETIEHFGFVWPKPTRHNSQLFPVLSTVPMRASRIMSADKQ